jgi:hypothetical protein
MVHVRATNHTNATSPYAKPRMKRMNMNSQSTIIEEWPTMDIYVLRKYLAGRALKKIQATLVVPRRLQGMSRW